jgi:glycosyltransferase involved in cell wall biosynthesis
MRVVFFHRKPNPGNYSIEKIFRQLRNALPPEVKWSVRELFFLSRGFFKRLFSMIVASLHQGDVNHITGDIHFIALLLKRNRTILTVHDIGLVNHPNFWVRKLFQWFWVILPVKRVNVVTTVSNETKLQLLKFVSVNPAKIKVIYNPIPSVFTKSTKTFNKKEPRILQIGTKANKNVFRLIQALQDIPCFLDIVGNVDGDLLRLLEKANIKFVVSKNLSDEDILKKYTEADIISFVSTFEGFGMPIVEANAVGRVVITSNVSSMPEVAGNAAHLVDPFSVSSIHEGILKVIDDDQYREQLITNGFVNCKRFDASVITKQYLDIYTLISINQK